MDAERLLAVGGVEAEVLPEAGRLHEQLGRFAGEEVDVAAGVEVALHGEGDRRVDVVLRGAGGVVRRRLLAVDRAPREQRADLVQLGRPLAGGRQLAPAEAQHLARQLRVRVGEEGHDVDLGVPEVVALVAAAGDRLGGDALLLGLGAGLGELEQVPAQRLLPGVVADELDVALLPEAVEPLALLDDQGLGAVVERPGERAVAAVGELLGGHARRRVVRDELDDAQHLPRLHARRHHRLRQVLADGRLHRARCRSVDEVVVGAGQRHRAVGAAVAQDDLAGTLAVQARRSAPGGRTGATCAGRRPCRGRERRRGTRPRRPDG